MRPRSKFLLLAILPLLVSLGLIALAMRQQQQDLSRRERQVVETAYMAAKQTELLNHVDLARSLLAPLYDTRRDDAEIRAEALRLLAAMDYGIDGYFFVFDAGGRNLLHPRQPELQNQDLWDLKDAQGVPLIRELIARAHEGGGFVRYLWQKPSTRALTPKLAYAISLQRWNMVIGTGLYLDDIQGTLAQIDRQVDENVASTMLWIAGIALFGLVLIGGSGMALNFSDREGGRCQAAQPCAPGGQVAGGRTRAPVARTARQHQPDAGVDQAAARIGREPARPRGHARGAAARRAAPGRRLQEVRRISHRLRPAELDTLGLPAALDDLAEEFNQHGRVRVALRLWGSAETLPDEVNTVLFRVVQESLTNIEKHAQATHVQVAADLSRRRPAPAHRRRRHRLRRAGHPRRPAPRHRLAQHARAGGIDRRRVQHRLAPRAHRGAGRPVERRHGTPSPTTAEGRMNATSPAYCWSTTTRWCARGCVRGWPAWRASTWSAKPATRRRPSSRSTRCAPTWC